MSQGEHKILGPLSARVSDIRRKMADLVMSEKNELATAKSTMERERLATFNRNGVEFALVPGETKLRVRLTSKKAKRTSDE